MDQPPLIALITWLVRTVLGQSLAAIRLLPALAGVAEVVLTALIARELGGKRFAQALAALAALIAPGILGRRRPADDECIRAAVLDGLRISADPPDQNRKHKAVDLVWRFGGIRSRK